MPSAVGCSVMSVSHSRFGPVAVKSRSTRSSCTGGPGRFARAAFAGVRGEDPGLRAQPPHPPFAREVAGGGELVGDEPVPELGVVVVDVQRGVGEVGVVAGRGR